MTNILTGMMGAAGVSRGGVYVGSPPSGYRAWYRADTVTESGGAVSQWDDKSGNSFDIGAMDASYKPTYNTTDSNFDSHPTINFGVDDGANNYKFYNASGGPTWSDVMNNSGTSLFQAFTWALVWNATTGQSPGSYDAWLGDNPGYMWFGMSSDTQVAMGNGTFTQTGLALGTTYASIINAQGGSDGSITITIETTGETTATYTSWNSASHATGRNTGVMIGGGSIASYMMKGQLADVLIYNTSLDASDTTTLKNYFANSYDLTW